MQAVQTVIAAPTIPVGKIKSFGPLGEQYEVLRPVRASQDGDWWVEIQLVKTGEKVEYPLSHIEGDPDGF